MQIFVRGLRGRTVAFNVQPCGLVDELRTEISQSEGIPLEFLCLRFAGRRLRDGLVLAECGIEKDATLQVHLLPPARWPSAGAQAVPQDIAVRVSATEVARLLDRYLQRSSTLEERERVDLELWDHSDGGVVKGSAEWVGEALQLELETELLPDTQYTASITWWDEGEEHFDSGPNLLAAFEMPQLEDMPKRRRTRRRRQECDQCDELLPDFICKQLASWTFKTARAGQENHQRLLANLNVGQHGSLRGNLRSHHADRQVGTKVQPSWKDDEALNAKPPSVEKCSVRAAWAFREESTPAPCFIYDRASAAAALSAVLRASARGLPREVVDAAKESTRLGLAEALQDVASLSEPAFAASQEIQQQAIALDTAARAPALGSVDTRGCHHGAAAMKTESEVDDLLSLSRELLQYHATQKAKPVSDFAGIEERIVDALQAVVPHRTPKAKSLPGEQHRSGTALLTLSSALLVSLDEAEKWRIGEAAAAAAALENDSALSIARHAAHVLEHPNLPAEHFSIAYDLCVAAEGSWRLAAPVLGRAQNAAIALAAVFSTYAVALAAFAVAVVQAKGFVDATFTPSEGIEKLHSVQSTLEALEEADLAERMQSLCHGAKRRRTQGNVGRANHLELDQVAQLAAVDNYPQLLQGFGTVMPEETRWPTFEGTSYTGIDVTVANAPSAEPHTVVAPP